VIGRFTTSGETMAEHMRAMRGPFAADGAVRSAVTTIWGMLPPEQRSVAAVEGKMRELVERALSEFKEDCASFGFQ
jgi:hypothetical protein